MSLKELIEAADNLCRNLEKASENEKAFCYEIQHQLERYSWDMYRLRNELDEIKQYTGA